MQAIATRFKNLRELTIHVGLGISIAIKNAQNGFPLTKAFNSVLTKEIARVSARQFLDCRGLSKLKKLTLKTGEDLRWFPQWHPGYADAEEECSRIFEIDARLGQDGEISLKELDSTHFSLWKSWESFQIASGRRGNAPTRISTAPRVFQASSSAQGQLDL